MVSTELEVSIENKKKVFCKRKENYISIQMEHPIPFRQLLVKEILVNVPWRLYGSQHSLLLSWPLRNYLCISILFNSVKEFNKKQFKNVIASIDKPRLSEKVR